MYTHIRRAGERQHSGQAGRRVVWGLSYVGSSVFFLSRASFLFSSSDFHRKCYFKVEAKGKTMETVKNRWLLGFGEKGGKKRRF